MARRPEIGNVQLYPDRLLRRDDKNGYVLKFYCPIRQARIRKNCGTRDRREARRILRECRERLLNGEYVASGGAITVALVQASTRSHVTAVFRRGEVDTDAIITLPTDRKQAEEPADDDAPLPIGPGCTWQECYDHYYRHRKKRGRKTSLNHAASRIEIAGRILDVERENRGLPADGLMSEYATLAALEHLQERLLVGDEGLYDHRAQMSVNTMLGAVMAFYRHCKRHGAISEVPPLQRLEVEETMKGRPITEEEFEQFLEAAPEVVGERSAESWQFILRIIWESAFRVGDVMNFSWDNDERRIHPVWPRRPGVFPTLLIPSSQKNKKAQEVPMLPGLQSLLETLPSNYQRGWVANLLPGDGYIRLRDDWFRPTDDDLAALAHRHNTSAIARACGVSETAVRKWIRGSGIKRDPDAMRPQGEIPADVIEAVRTRAAELLSVPVLSADGRFTPEHVGRVISAIGEKAGIVVQQPDEETGRRLKYASAHDIRRGCAVRLINAGVSAETLMVIMRHKDFRTTQKFYGAVRAAQSAAAEVYQKLMNCKKNELVGGLVGGIENVPQLNAAEVKKLKALLDSI